MDSFPAFFPLAGAKVVLAGKGPGIEAKARLLASSPAVLVRLEGNEALLPGAYRGARLAFVAGDDELFAQAAAAAARAAHVLVNVIDRPAWSDFNTPAVVDRGEVVAAIGTGGASPVLATLLVGSAGWMSMPFFLAGGIKIVYDLLLYRAFATSEAGKKV